MNWTFRPPLWSILGMLAGVALFSTAGYWQLSRGLQKQRLIAQYDAAGQPAERLRLDAGAAAADGAAPRAAQVQGSYVQERQLLLDDQVLAGRPGFDVWTPMRLEDGSLLIVNRGWVQQTGNRRLLPALPAPSGEITVTGYWRALPRPAMRLGQGQCQAPASAAAQWPRIVDYPTIEDLRCLYGEKVVAGELLLSPDAPGGYARDWRALPAEMPPGRHYGYAAQWFAFAATLLGIFIKLNLKRIP